MGVLVIAVYLWIAAVDRDLSTNEIEEFPENLFATNKKLSEA